MAEYCPRCGRSRLVSGKRHCASPTCTWAICSCRATYEKYGTGSYHPDDWTKKEEADRGS